MPKPDRWNVFLIYQYIEYILHTMQREYQEYQAHHM